MAGTVRNHGIFRAYSWTVRAKTFIFGSMPLVRILNLVATSALFALGSTLASAAELPVSLFGAPCALRGPYELPVLKQIHAISPERVSPLGLGNPNDLLRKAQENLKNAGTLPAQLDRYRERLGKRLEAQVAFFTGLSQTKQSKKSADFMRAIQKFLVGKPTKDLEALAKKLETDRSADTVELVLESFQEKIGNDPEEDFHRAIQRMGVQYICAFDETGADGAASPAANSESN